MARLKKHLADLHLLTGQLKDAGDSYRNASEQLKSQKDWLWAGGAHEGLSVTAMMTKECELVLGQKAQGVEATVSFSHRLQLRKVSHMMSCDRSCDVIYAHVIRVTILNVVQLVGLVRTISIPVLQR